MNNKKFNELVVGDNVFKKINETIETHCIKEIEKIDGVLVKFKFYGDRFLDFNPRQNNEFNSDFIIVYGDVKIATSMDRLLLECDDTNE